MGSVHRPEGSISELSLRDKFSTLEHLDLSWNHLCDLGGVLRALTWVENKYGVLFFARCTQELT